MLISEKDVQELESQLREKIESKLLDKVSCRLFELKDIKPMIVFSDEKKMVENLHKEWAEINH